ncbi:unnamed protein product [Caenorhabditis nigoni]
MNAVHIIPDPFPATVIAIQPQPYLPPPPGLDQAGSVPVGIKEQLTEHEEAIVCCHWFCNNCCCDFLGQCLGELIRSICQCCCEICCNALCSCN